MSSFARNISIKSSRYNYRQVCHYSKQKGKFRMKTAGNIGKHETFSEMQKWRGVEAKRSILMQCPESHLPLLLNHCEKVGQVRSVFPFKQIFPSNTIESALVEFDELSSVSSLMAKCRHFSNDMRIPVQSRHLFFRYKMSYNAWQGLPVSDRRIRSNNNDGMDTETNLLSHLMKVDSLSEQIDSVQRHLQLTDLDCRLRYFVTSLVEDSLQGILHKSVLHPFGSAVNGFGRHDCDLDMLMELEDPDTTTGESTSPFLFMSKMKSENERLFIQSLLDTVAGILGIMPKFTRLRRILKARVPIVKFHYAGMNLDCDLSLGVNNRSAVYMSELLYIFGQLDPRVRPLMFTVRYWAKTNQLVYSNPGPWISNFGLTLLVLYFLQTRQSTILPSIGKLADLAGPNDIKTINGEDCSFTSEWYKIPDSRNADSLETLLMEFFDFYACFNFKQDGISLVKASTCGKEDTSALHLENPLERELNVTKNVMSGEVDRFQAACADSLRTYDGSSSRTSQSDTKWGLLSILGSNTTHRDSPGIKMKNLFDDDVNKISVNRNDSNLDKFLETDDQYTKYYKSSTTDFENPKLDDTDRQKSDVNRDRDSDTTKKSTLS